MISDTDHLRGVGGTADCVWRTRLPNVFNIEVTSPGDGRWLPRRRDQH